MSDDYTEFNGDYATRLDGKAMNSRLAEAAGKNSGKTIGRKWPIPKYRYTTGCCHPDLQLCRSNSGQGREDDADPRKIDARVREKGRQMDVGPRKLCGGSTTKILRP